MEVSGQFHALAALPPEKMVTVRMGYGVRGPRAGLDAAEYFVPA
jgi:hypothetical protein